VGVFALLKTVYRDEVEQLYREDLDTVDKKHFTSLHKSTRERALTKRNIMVGWIATGLFSFNLERVLRHTSKAPIELTVPKANKAMSCSQEQVLQTPITPITPVMIGALTLLHNIIKQELNKPSKDRIQRHVQKLACIAQILFVKQTLLQDQNRFLSKINNKVKVCQSIRSVILGKTKVISYEDLEEARAKRAAKEKAIASKGKRDPKRKSPTLEPEPEPEPELEAQAGSPKAVTDSSMLKDKVARMSKIEPAKTLGAPWRAPVGRMY